MHMKKVIVITGPTAVGKTKLSIALAKLLSGEIINADSTQVYQGLDIATAKVTLEEQENIKHHLFDICPLTEDYTVYQYQIDARKKIEEISSRGNIPILVGGTGLYIKATLLDYQFQPQETEQEKVETTDVLYQRLKEIDPHTSIHPHNRNRIIRALTLYETTKLIPSEKPKTEEFLYEPIVIGLTTDRDILYERINCRVDEMVQMGLLEEAKQIYDSSLRSKAVMTPIGYKELFPYFEGNCTLEDALEKIKQKSRNYAKRQYTWWNHQMKVNWFPVNFNDFDATIQEVYHYVSEQLTKES